MNSTRKVGCRIAQPGRVPRADASALPLCKIDQGTGIQEGQHRVLTRLYREPRFRSLDDPDGSMCKPIFKRCHRPALELGFNEGVLYLAHSIGAETGGKALQRFYYPS